MQDILFRLLKSEVFLNQYELALYTLSDTFIFFGFHEINKIKLCIECVEFSETIQELEIHLLINEQQIELDKEEIIKNELFKFNNSINIPNQKLKVFIFNK